MPPNQKQHYLVAVLGKTPQILTETLYALCVERKISISSVFVISTAEGASSAKEFLLQNPCGKLHVLKQDYPEYCRQIHFPETQIHIAEDNLLPVKDIRSRQDSDMFLDLILQLLWEKSGEKDVALHCSIAGGRKTMSTYLALALQLLGRPQDALYHVLVDPLELEHHPDFYFPSKETKILELSDGRRFDASQAKIDLVDIPFIRLRDRIQIDKYDAKTGYRQLLEWVQRDLDTALVLPELVLDLPAHTLNIGSDTIRLQPQRYCLYWYFADLSKNRPESVRATDYGAYFEPSSSPYFSEKLRDGLLARFDVLDRSGTMRNDFRRMVLEKGELPSTWVSSTMSRINAQIRMQLTQAHLLPFCLISAEGKRGSKYYGIKLDRDKIITPEVGG